MEMGGRNRKWLRAGGRRAVGVGWIGVLFKHCPWV